MEPQDRKLFLAQLRRAIKAHGIAKVAKAAGILRQHLWAIIRRDVQPSDRARDRLDRAAKKLEGVRTIELANTAALLAQVNQRCEQIGLRSFAKLADVDEGNLSRILRGKRKTTAGVVSNIKRALIN